MTSMLKYDIKGFREVEDIGEIIKLFEPIELGEIIVEEKIDGIQTKVVKENGYFNIYSKGNVPIQKSRMGPKEKREILSNYAKLYPKLLNLLEVLPNQNAVLVFEFLPEEKPEYLHVDYKKEAKGKFYLLEVYVGNQLLNRQKREEIATKIGTPLPAVFDSYNSWDRATLKEIIRKLEEGEYVSKISESGEPEGVVIKQYAKNHLNAFKIRKEEDRKYISRVLKEGENFQQAEEENLEKIFVCLP